MDKLVSCITPTFNRAELVKAAIESSIEQTYPHWEHIVVDDQSSDHTEAVVRAYAERDPRVKYLRNPGKGQNSARNFGIRAARGEYLAFLDDDDKSLPHRFESQLRAMLKSGNRFLVSGYRVVNQATGETIAEEKLGLKAGGAGFPSRWMVARSLWEQVGGFDEDYPSMTDVEFSYRVAEHETFALHDDIVTAYFVTPGSASRIKSNTVKGRLLLMERNESRMHPLEAAWWHFIIGLDFYGLKEDAKADEHFRKAANLDPRGIYRWASRYYQLAGLLKGPFRKLNFRVLKKLSNYRFPVLVHHPVVK